MSDNLNNKPKILIVEDEIIIAETAKTMINSLGYDVIGTANNIKKTLNLLENKKTNLVLLDINLGEGNEGIEIAKIINEKYQIPFIFLTSYGDMQTRKEASPTHPAGYITKPFNKEELYTGIEIALSNFEPCNQSINLKIGHTNVKINLDEILWIKSDNVYVEIVTINKKYVHRTSLDSILKTLEVPKFQRIHRSYAINLNQIEEVDANCVNIKGHKIPVSRKYKEELMDKFGKN